MTQKQVGKKAPRTRIASHKTPPPGGGEGKREADRYYREKATRFARSGEADKSSEEPDGNDDRTSLDGSADRD